MLIEFSVRNFRSIAEVQSLSLVANESLRDGENQTFAPTDSEFLAKLTLLKTAVLYGANAAGKSNIVKALNLMKRIVVTSARQGQRGDELPVTPFKLDFELEKEPTEFEAVFIAGGVRYQYGFSATSSRIVQEWLYAFPKGRPQEWFMRDWNIDNKEYVWSFGANFLGKKQVWRDATRENALFLSTAVQLNSEQLKPVFDWFEENLRFLGMSGSANFSIEFCDKGSKERILSFLKKADVGIDDLEISSEKFNSEKLPADMPEALRDMIQKEMNGREVFEVFTKHKTVQDKMVLFDLDEESTGTQKLFAFAGPWLDALDNGYILVVDELHDNLHPKLVRYLVELFHNSKTNPKNAQLFFTTHETSILNQSVFRRDQIWFCEKNKEGATILFPLTDFSPRKGVENLEQAYLSGRYGAVPFIDSLYDGLE